MTDQNERQEPEHQEPDTTDLDESNAPSESDSPTANKPNERQRRNIMKLAVVAAIAAVIGAGSVGYSIGYSSANKAWLHAERPAIASSAPATPTTGRTTDRNPLPELQTGNAPDIQLESAQQAAERAGTPQRDLGKDGKLPAPRFNGVSLKGEPISLEAAVGEGPVMLVFWAHW